MIRLEHFDGSKGLDRGRFMFIEMAWYIIKMIFLLSAFPWPNQIKSRLLKIFGAKIGKRVIIKPRVNIHFPWKLELGDDVWLGEEVFILNFELIKIESNVCVSQRTFLCGGNHDYRDPTFKYRNGPITVKEGAWIGAQCFVGPDLTINRNCVVSAGSIVTQSLPNDKVCSGNPCLPIKDRWKKV